MPEREREAVHRRVQLARDPLGDAPQAGVLRGREQHDDVALRIGRAFQHRRQRAGGAGARGALGGGQHAGAPVVVGGRVVVRAHDDHGTALAQVGPELGGAGEDVAAIGHLALEERGQERRLGGLGGAVGRAQALDLAGDHGRRDPQHRGARPAAAGAQAQAADDRVADPQLVRLDAVGVAHQRALVRRRARGDREHGARAIDQDQRRVERARSGPDDFREAEAGLHRVRHRTERAEIGQRRLFAGGRGHALKVRRDYSRSLKYQSTAAPTPAPASTNAASTYTLSTVATSRSRTRQ